MLNLYKSNDIHLLVKELAKDIKKNNEGKLFDSPIHRIVIPSLVNKAWLNFELEKELGVLFRVEYDNLNWCPYRLAKEIGIKNLDQTATRKDLFFEILSILKNNSIMNKSEMALVRNYINDKFERVSTEKTFQFAEKLADVFIKYIDNNVESNSEKDIIGKWNKIINSNMNYEGMSEVEICEFLIYNELIKSRGEKSGITRLTILKEFDFTDAKYTDNIKLYIFNYPFISEGNLATLKTLSDYIDTKIYYNPICGELPICEDEEYDNYSKKSIQSKYDNNLLKYISSEAQSEELEVSKENSVLNSIKYGVCGGIPQDKSFQVLACPGIYREVECVYNSIIYNLNNNPDLRPEDIGVILTDTNKYFPAVNGVFGMNSDKVPFNLICGMPNAVNDYIEGIKKLAYISEELFTKESVQDLFENSCFKKKFNISEKEVEEFMKYAEGENIWAFFNGDSKNKFFNRKENPLTDQYTWDWSGANMRLGSIMDLDEEDNKWEGYIPSHSISDYKMFFNVLGKIYYEITYYKKLNIHKSSDIKKYSQEVIGYFQNFIKSFLKSEKENDSVKILIDNSIDDFIKQCATRNYLPTFNEVAEYINMVASSSNYSKGRAFTGGVVVGKLFNMRVCNFKILYVLGLNEGVFPRQDNKSSLDLTLGFLDRITGEEEDKYALYKLITGTEKKVYLTYSSKDLEKEAQLYPSGALSELIDYIEKNIIKAEFKKMEMPMFGRSLLYYREADFPYSDAFLNYSENDMKLAKIDYDQTFYNKEKEPYVEPEFIKDTDIDADTPLKLNVKDIVTFLINPIEWTLKSLGMKDKFENEKDYVYEPVSIKNFECDKIINESIFELYNFVKEEDLENIDERSFNKVIKKYSDNGLIPQNKVGERLVNILKDNYNTMLESFELKEGSFESNLLIGYPSNVFEKYENSLPAEKIQFDSELKEELKREELDIVNDLLDENITDNNKEIIINKSYFPYGVRDVELSCLIPIVNEENDIFFFKYGKEKPKYEYEAKIMLLVYILATRNLKAKAYYICDKIKEFQYEIIHNNIGINEIFTDESIPEEIIEENLQLIRQSLGKILTDMQNVKCLYEYLPMGNKKEYDSDEEYINEITSFGPYSSHKHYIIENLPNILSINKDNPTDIINERKAYIDHLFYNKMKGAIK